VVIVPRRGVLTSGALGITSVVLPGAAEAATIGPATTPPPPDPPIAAATVAGGVLSITLATPAGDGTDTLAVWRDGIDPTIAPTSTSTVTTGVSTVAVGTGGEAGDPLPETQSHVVRVTRTTAGGSATSTLTLTARVLAATGATAGAAGGGSGGTGGAGAATDEATIVHPVVGFGPTAATFTVTGAAGGRGGDDGVGAGGAGGVGGTLAGRIAVASGDVLRLHAGGEGGAGADGSSIEGGYGRGGASTIVPSYAGADGGRPGGSGSSGGGGGGGAATVLRRTRVGGALDVVAAGGGGGGGSGNKAGESLGARDFDAASISTTTNGRPGQAVAANVDGGGGGGGGGGVIGGGSGETYSVQVSDRFELFGRGGRRGSSSGAGGDVTVDSSGVAGSAAPGTGTVRWHDVGVSHSAPVTVLPTVAVAGAGVATDATGSTLTLAFPAAAGGGTHAYDVWNATTSTAGTPDATGTVTAGATRLVLGPYAAAADHVVRVTHTEAGATATSTLTLSPASLTASATAGGDRSGATGGTGGAGAQSAAQALSFATAGFGPTSVAFTLTGAGGGTGGDDVGQIGGVAGLGERIVGTLAVADGDTIRLHAGGGGGAGGSNANGAGAAGGAGGSTLTGAYGGGAGGRPGPSGTSGGGGGGGAATVLRRARASVALDVVAAGGGGGGGAGSVSVGSDRDARAFDLFEAFDRSDGAQGSTVGEAGEPRSDGDGGGGGGGGGGVHGGGRGDLVFPSGEPSGRGGRRGLTSVSDAGIVAGTPSTPGAARDAGVGTVNWHTVAVTQA